MSNIITQFFEKLVIYFVSQMLEHPKNIFQKIQLRYITNSKFYVLISVIY